MAAVSVGIVAGVPVLDLDYAEDSQAETDMNVVMNNGGAFVEIQGTAEGHAFRRHELDALLDLATAGIAQTVRAAGAGAAGPVTRVVLASGNAGKLREFAALLAPLDLAARAAGRSSASPRSRRPARTFLANALLKARHAAAATRGCRRWPMIPGSRSTPWAGVPGSGRRAIAGEGASDADNLAAAAAANSRACRDAAAPRALSVRHRVGAQRGRSCSR